MFGISMGIMSPMSFNRPAYGGGMSMGFSASSTALNVNGKNIIGGLGGGILGGLGGGLLGFTVGGPVGAIIGGVLGAGLGGHLGSKVGQHNNQMYAQQQFAPQMGMMGSGMMGQIGMPMMGQMGVMPGMGMGMMNPMMMQSQMSNMMIMQMMTQMMAQAQSMIQQIMKNGGLPQGAFPGTAGARGFTGSPAGVPAAGNAQGAQGQLAPSKTGSALADYASKWAGKSFKPGQTCRCADFVSTMIEKSGAAPKGFKHQLACAQLQKYGKSVPKGQLKPGDIVYFGNTYRKGKYTHVGIYIGNGKFVHRPTANKPVKVDSLNSSYYKSKYSGARRLG